MDASECRVSPIGALIDLSVRSYADMMRLWMGCLGLYSFAPRCETPGASVPRDRVIVRGAVGTEAKGTICIRNSEFRTVRVRVSPTSGLVGPNDEDVDARVTVEPDEFELGPWQTRNVTVSAQIVQAMEVGVDYRTRVDAYRHVQHTEVVVRREG